MTRFQKQYSNRFAAVFSIFLCLFLSMALSAQVNTSKGVISGQVFTVDDEPAEAVAVKITGTVEKLTLTSETGFYIFKNLPAGTYHVDISVKGYKDGETTITANRIVLLSK